MTRLVPDDYYISNEDDEWLTRVVVDTCLRKFYLYSNEGETKELTCDSVDQFMNVLEVVRALVDESSVVYAEPLESNP